MTYSSILCSILNMSYRKFVGFNLKMNPISAHQAQNLASKFAELKKNSNFDFAIFIPDIFLNSFKLNHTTLLPNLGSQNVSDFDSSGAYTAEISAKMYSELGISYCLIGHSETRKNYKLSLEQINQKIQNTFNQNLTPVVCTTFVGSDNSKVELLDDLKMITKSLNREKQILIAFEPLNSIGSQAMNETSINEYLGLIRNFMIANKFSNFRVLYGGGVNSQNILQIIKLSNVDGVLIGASSLVSSELELIFETVNANPV